MIVLSPNAGTESLHQCPVNKCSGNHQEEITKYWSLAHAADAGWVFTNDPLYCDPDTDLVVVCPDCVRFISAISDRIILHKQPVPAYTNRSTETGNINREH